MPIAPSDAPGVRQSNRHPVGFFPAIRLAYANTFNYTDRASRAEYWWYVVYALIPGMIIPRVPEWTTTNVFPSRSATLLAGIVTILLISPPWLALASRRLRDTDRGWGWWCVLALGPFSVGFAVTAFALVTNHLGRLLTVAFLGLAAIFLVGIVQVVILALPGTQGPNRYGPDPRTD